MRFAILVVHELRTTLTMAIVAKKKAGLT
ncbi:hypothetical protein SPHINGOR109_51186 [Sphingorhabdus sp. 109]|nr:hypothetical protein SPHINGOR109_51186 [Sphingorhabdus sp. 109]